jgi:RNA polymerase sigma-70 factor (ECF subfamily)
LVGDSRELAVVSGQEWSVDRSEVTIDRARLARLYDDHVDAVYAYLARRVGADVALDVLADVFEAAFAQLDRFDPARGSERAWLFGIATNLLRRHWRTEQRRLLAWRRASVREIVPGDPLLDAA